MIDPRDIRVDVYRCAAAGCGCDTQVTMTHLPTGLTAKGDHPSQLKARDIALAELERKLAER